MPNNNKPNEAAGVHHSQSCDEARSLVEEQTPASRPVNKLYTFFCCLSWSMIAGGSGAAAGLTLAGYSKLAGLVFGAMDGAGMCSMGAAACAGRCCSTSSQQTSTTNVPAVQHSI